MALTERLALIISGEAGGAVRELDALGGKLTGVHGIGQKVTRQGTAMGTAYAAGAVLAGAALVKMLKSGTDALMEQQRVDAQVKAVIASTGGIAQVSAQHVDSLAKSIEGYSTQSRDAVKASEVVLLSFTAVQNQVGAGNDIFDRATVAVSNLSARFGTDLTTTARQLGRALQDPVAGMSALTRSGIAFDAATKEQIKTLAKQGNLLGAQKVLLAAVDDKVKGAAKAAGDTAAGGFAKLTNQLTELDKVAAGPILHPLTAALGEMVKLAEEINAHPFAEKIASGVAILGTAAVAAEVGMRALKAIRGSELATTIAGSAARVRSTATLEAETVAARQAALAFAELDAAQAGGGIGAAGGELGGIASTGGRLAGIGGRLAGVGALGMAATAVPVIATVAIAANMANDYTNSQNAKGVANMRAALAAGGKGAADAKNLLHLMAKNSGNDGGLFKALPADLQAVGKAVAATAPSYGRATQAVLQHSAALRVNMAAADQSLADWKKGAPDRAKAIAQAAAGFDIFGAKTDKTKGLSARTLLGNEAQNVKDQQQLAADSKKLVQAGLSAPVLAQIQATEANFPGTIHHLVGSLSASMVAKMNADQAKIDAARKTYLGMSNAQTGKLLTAGAAQGHATYEAWLKGWRLASTLDPVPMPKIPGPPGGSTPPTPPSTPKAPVYGTGSGARANSGSNVGRVPSRPNPAGTSSNTTININNNGPINYNDLAHQTALAKRLAALGT